MARPLTTLSPDRPGAVWSSAFSGLEATVEGLLVCTGIVALAEIGDKTQLLALVLAAKFRQPTPIIVGILVATPANHTLRGAAGSWLTALNKPHIQQWVLGASVIGMALWTLIPDKLNADHAKLARLGVFGTTLVTFFLAETGDKTQIATVVLAAQYQALVSVVAGTTLGMLIANVPAVLLGDRFGDRQPVRLVHRIAAAIFASLGVVTLLQAAGVLRL